MEGGGGVTKSEYTLPRTLRRESELYNRGCKASYTRVRRLGSSLLLSHQQTVENQTTDYNLMVLHLRVVTHCTGIYRNIIVCHFQITDSRQRVITRYNPL